MYEPKEPEFQDYLDIWQRRKWLALRIGGSLLLVTLFTALLWPAVYQSTATILIEQQDIPEDIVRSLASVNPDQRIQIISQRVMTSTNLIEIMNRHNLYPRDRRREPLEVVVEMMREDVRLDPINADVVDPQSGRSGKATIAFTLGYRNAFPELAQAVANELVSLFMRENLKARTESAQEATNFLADEAEKLREQVLDMERQIATFKETNIDVLPEFAQLNLELRANSERELAEIDRQIRSYEQQRILLSAELARTDPVTDLYTDAGRPLLGPEDQLRVLRTDLISSSVRYGERHPDRIKLMKQVEALEQHLGRKAATADLATQLEQLRVELDAATKRYSAEHPDVRQLARMVDLLETELGESPAGRELRTAADQSANPNNPAYVQLKVRVDANDQELNTLRDKRDDVRQRLRDIEGYIARTPAVEREMRNMARDYQNALVKYQEVTAKRMEADVSRSLEREQKGERLTLIEPPVLPEEPDSPNRWLILLLGTMLSLAGGIGGVGLAEAMDNSVHGATGILAVTSLAPIGSIPLFQRPDRSAAGRLRWLTTAAVMALTLATLLVIFHINVMPLDIAFFTALRRIALAFR